MRVLVVEDEKKVARALREGLEAEHYDVRVASAGEEGFFLVNHEAFDCVVLDLMLPQRDGLEVLTTLRKRGLQTPVLILTAKDTIDDRVRGLDSGADDYLVKPFALEELFARLRALLRRTDGAAPGDVLEFADLTLDTGTRGVRRGDREMELTRTEFSLLELFLRNPRQVLTRSVIFERVWGYDFGPTSNSLEVYVGYLRRKTEAGGEPRLIHTVRGVGYALREQ
jgi:two-component system response regulator MprA